MTDYIGRWSMVDVFVVAILVGVVQLGSVMTINAGEGAFRIRGRSGADDAGGAFVRPALDLGRSGQESATLPSQRSERDIRSALQIRLCRQRKPQ